MTRTNSTGTLNSDRRLARNHRVAVFVAALVAMAACFALLPGATLSDSLVQTAALAAIAVAAVGVSRPAALGGLSARRGRAAASGRGLRTCCSWAWWEVRPRSP